VSSSVRESTIDVELDRRRGAWEGLLVKRRCSRSVLAIALSWT
jgi:hypothetical protein